MSRSVGGMVRTGTEVSRTKSSSSLAASTSTTPASSAVGDRTDRLAPFARLLVAALIGAALFLTGFWVGSARGGAERDAGAHAKPVPDWFLPIWDLYDRNPRVTPETDFALLHETRPRMLARAAEAAFVEAARLRASKVVTRK